MTRQEALGRLLELEDYFCRRFADAPMESEEEAEAYKHARAVKSAIMLLSQEEADAENLSAAAAASPLLGETRGEAAGWISIEDRLPEKDEVVIIYGKYICSGEIIYTGMLITDIDEFVHSGYVPIAWMPLPEPPEGYKNEID